jgi:hypothetical protein
VTTLDGDPVAVPTDLDADDALRLIGRHAGAQLERALLVVAAHVRHLREERDALMDLNTQMHHELVNRDMGFDDTPGCPVEGHCDG